MSNTSRILLTILLIILVIIISFVIILYFVKWKQQHIVGGAVKPSKLTLNDVKILYKLGSGWMGDAYLAEYKGKPNYVVKKQKIIPEKIYELNPGNYILDPKYASELSFYIYINKLPKKSRKYFVELYDYKIHKCQHKHKLPEAIKQDMKYDFGLEEYIKKHLRSPYCVEQLIEYGGDTLQPIKQNMLESSDYTHDKFGRRLAHDLFSAVKIIHDGGYVHRDIYSRNIVVKSGNFKLVDYGEVVQKDTELGDILHYMNTDLLQAIEVLTFNDIIINYFRNDVEIPDYYDQVDYIRKIERGNALKKIISKLEKIYKESDRILFELKKLEKGQEEEDNRIYTLLQFHIVLFFQMLHPKKSMEFWSKYLLESYREKIWNNYVSDSDFKFIVNNFNNIDKLIAHFDV